MIPNFDKREKLLLKNFNSLRTVLERLQFWDKILQMSYIEYLYNHNDYKNLRKFKIGKEPMEWKEINDWILNNYSPYLEEKNLKNNLLNIRALTSEFNYKSNLIRDKSVLIKSEMAEIDNSFKAIFSKFNANYQCFENYYEYQLKPDYSKIEPHLITVIQMANGQTLAEYKLYLEKLLKKYIKPVENDHLLNSLNLTQIALLLKYSGILKGMNGAKAIEKARLLSSMLNVGEKGIYDEILSVDLKKNKSIYNFEQIINYLKQNKIKYPLKVLQEELRECKT
jgi:hypothetical protein